MKIFKFCNFIFFLSLLSFIFFQSDNAFPFQGKTFQNQVQVWHPSLGIQKMNLEAYVLQVLSGEMSVDSPLEALKAQAVLIRTYAISSKGRHQSEGFDFCHLTHCQVFPQKLIVSAKLKRAVNSTRGLILFYQNQPIQALYHSTCGGHTSPNQKVFGGKSLPYLQGVDDASYCSQSPHFRWTAKLSFEEIISVFYQHLMHPKNAFNISVSPELREKQGRWFALNIIGVYPIKTSAQNFLLKIGRSLGWSRLKSTWFEVEVKELSLYFKGNGLGHGVGMCQWGAIGRAKAGENFREILYDYFPGTRLKYHRF